VLRVLLAEEVTGRDAATRRMRRKTGGFPAGEDVLLLARRTRGHQSGILGLFREFCVLVTLGAS
jgi:hypothetical protein